MIKVLTELKDYVPVLQTLIWIIFFITIFLIFYKQIRDLFNVFKKRIEKGSSFKAGPFEVGEELRELDYAKPYKVEKTNLIGSDGKEREAHRTEIYKNNRGIFLTHIISPSKSPGQLFDIFIYLTRHNRKDFSD